MNHPIQPLDKDPQGTLRFKANAIVSYLLDNGGIDMNMLASKEFSVEDREQFAQLIGYSLNGFGELSYVRMETYAAAALMAETGVSETEARIQYLEDELASLRNSLREPVSRLFGIHPDDLPEQP